MDFLDYNICCISHNRAEGITDFLSVVGTDDVIFFVKDEQDFVNYIKAGAKKVVVGGSLMDSRNIALEYCFKQNKISVQLSDDLVKVAVNDFTGKRTHKTITVYEALQKILPLFVEEPYYLAGFPPTDNPFFSTKPVEYSKFIVGDFIIIKPCKLKFDTNIQLKEDYDYTLQHIKTYSGCVRYGYFLNTFKHYTNKGGVVEYRSAKKEQETIKYLMAKWPKCIIENSKRPNEILLVKNAFDILNTKQQSLF